MLKQLLRSSIAITLLVLVAACATPQATLYQRLGGQTVVETFVSRTIDRSSTDERIKRSFDGIKLAPIKASIVQQICSISGGGCKYEGETMAKSHADAKIQPREFDALVDILREEMDRAGVDAGAKNDLLKLLAPMKRDIVHAAR